MAPAQADERRFSPTATTSTLDLFLDDLGDERLKGMVGALLPATPGHLGETFDEQHQVALLLGIRQLSSRFQVKLRLDGAQVLPIAWVAALRHIVTLIHSYAQEEGWDEVPLHTPDISYYQHISKSLVDSGVETYRWRRMLLGMGGRICVAGEPDDFAADLCRVLLQCAGFANRRDLDELASTVTQLIGWLDRQDKFNTRLEQLRYNGGYSLPPRHRKWRIYLRRIESSQDGPLPQTAICSNRTIDAGNHKQFPGNAVGRSAIGFASPARLWWPPNRSWSELGP